MTRINILKVHFLVFPIIVFAILIFAYAKKDTTNDSNRLYIKLDEDTVYSNSELFFSFHNYSTIPIWVAKKTRNGGYYPMYGLDIIEFPFYGTTGIFAELLDSIGNPIHYSCLTKSIEYSVPNFEYSIPNCFDFINFSVEAIQEEEGRASKYYKTISYINDSNLLKKEYHMHSQFKLIISNMKTTVNSWITDSRIRDIVENEKHYYVRLVLKQDSAEVRKEFLSGSISEKKFSDAKIFHGTLYSNKVPIVFDRKKKR